MVLSRLLLVLLAAALVQPVGAQEEDPCRDPATPNDPNSQHPTVPCFAYELVTAFGPNNERDVNSKACDLVNGCIAQDGSLCKDDPNSLCDRATVPAGRCSAGNNADNLWPSKAGECVGTFGYFSRDGNENLPSGYPCLTDAYLAALQADDPSQLDALEKQDGPGALCPEGGTCNMSRNSTTANCQFADTRPSVCVGEPTRACGIDNDCERRCVGGDIAGQVCETSLRDCKGDDPFAAGACVAFDRCAIGNCTENTLTLCARNGDCPGADTCNFEVILNDFEQSVCGGTQARCSDGDPTLAFGGLGTGLCVSIVVLGQIDNDVNCGSNAGTKPALATPRDPLENTPFVFTPQRDPGSGFLGTGPIRNVRSSSVVRVQTLADAEANTLGIRFIGSLGDSVWADSAFSAAQANGALDNIILGTSCDPPFPWETQLPTEGNCTAPNTDVLCVQDADCPGASTCENTLFCHEAPRDGKGFLWTRDIELNDSIPTGPGVPEHVATVWSTTPGSSTCPPICGTAYDHTTLESIAINNIGAADREAGIQLSLDVLKGRQAGAGDMITLAAAVTVSWVNQGDLRCQLGGRDPNDALKVGTCTASKIPCDPRGNDCAAVEVCEACGGRLIRAGDALAGRGPDPDGLNRRALPIGYNTHGIPALELFGATRVLHDGEGNPVLDEGENPVEVPIVRTGVLNGQETTVRVEIFLAATTGSVAAEFYEPPPCTGGQPCRLGESVAGEPGSVGIDTGGSFAANQLFAHGGRNGTAPVAWDPEDPPGGFVTPSIRVGAFGPGPDGIPGCIGNNDPGINAQEACRRRLARGPVTDSQWGFCTGGTAPMDQSDPNNLGPIVCKPSTGFFTCFLDFGGAACTVDPSLVQNTGVDDFEILTPVEDEGTPTNGLALRFGLEPGTTPIPNPLAAAPTLHLVAATTLRNLDVIDTKNADIIVKVDTTSCPISNVTRLADCFVGGCMDTDGDGVCDENDNCPFVANADQLDRGGVGPGPDGTGDACQCGDVTGDGVVNFVDAIMINREASPGLVAPLFNVPRNCDVTEDGLCNFVDAIMINREVSPGLVAPLFNAEGCPNAKPPVF